MKREELLEDVLRAGDYERFQSSVADEMIGEFRRLKAARLRRVMLAMAACVPLICAVMFWGRQTAPTVGQSADKLVIVHTEPLPLEMVVRTLPAVEVVSSREGIEYIERESAGVAIVSDQELLELFGDRPVALVRVGTSARLITPGETGNSIQFQ